MSIKKAISRLRPLIILTGFGGAILVLLLAFTLDRAFGEQVLMIAPHHPETVELNKGLFLPGDPIPDIYGNPLQEPVRVVLPARDRLLRPDEDPTLLLLEVDRLQGDNPLQARTVWFFTKFALPALTLLGLLGLILPRRRTVTETAST